VIADIGLERDFKITTNNQWWR